MYPPVRHSGAKVTKLMHDYSGGSLSAVQLSSVMIELDAQNIEFTGASTDLYRRNFAC